jgi:MerR family transcriptional regulator, redox-sensitive transcriptional activator SoxR
MKTYSIGEAARRTGLRPSALRWYEQAGVLPPAPRIGGRRRYDTDAIRRIELMRFAQRAGFTLEEVRSLLSGFDPDTPLSTRWQELGRAKLAELDRLAAELRQMRRDVNRALRCGCTRVEDCSLGATSTDRPTPSRTPRAARALRTPRPPATVPPRA